MLELEVREIRRLLERVEDTCLQMAIAPPDVVVQVRCDLGGRRAVVIPKLWRERELRGQHQDEPDPVTVYF